MKRKFWNWVRDQDTGERVLRLNGPIAEQTWLGDEVTPTIFRDELNSADGDITVWLNSPGGDVFAASQIYTMLMEYTGNVKVKIDGLAASAASIVAMSGTTVEMSPVSMMMIHNPATIAIGDTEEMKAAIKMLDEVKEGIINAYALKTNLPHDKLANMMTAETWMNAKKAVELGFADGILYSDNGEETADTNSDGIEPVAFSRMAVTNSLIDQLRGKKLSAPDNRVSAEQLHKRLNLLAH